jgi:hypothetical protein
VAREEDAVMCTFLFLDAAETSSCRLALGGRGSAPCKQGGYKQQSKHPIQTHTACIARCKACADMLIYAGTACMACSQGSALL